jgi:hypothetical protein
MPQWLRSVLRFVSQPLLSLPSQLPQPLLQEAIWHVPVEQVAVALVREHVIPHAPQFMSVLSCVSQPLLSLPSQLPQPLLQMQEPAEQEALAPQLWRAADRQGRPRTSVGESTLTPLLSPFPI